MSDYLIMSELQNLTNVATRIADKLHKLNDTLSEKFSDGNKAIIFRNDGSMEIVKKEVPDE